MTRGFFITLEGIEGAGKTTLASALRDAVTTCGLTVCKTREPGGTPSAERLRAVLLERGDDTISAVAETLLMFAARAIHVDTLIRPALNRGEWVLCDRFTDATRAYQGAGRGVSRELIESLAAAVHKDLQPDCTLLLDLPPVLGLQRAQARSPGASADRFESEALDFFARVRASYLALAAAEPQRFVVLDATLNAASMAQTAIAAVMLRVAP